MESRATSKTLVLVLFLLMLSSQSNGGADISCTVRITNDLPNGKSILVYVKEGKEPLEVESMGVPLNIRGKKTGHASLNELWKMDHGETLRWSILVKQYGGRVQYYFFWRIEDEDHAPWNSHLVLDSRTIPHEYDRNGEVYKKSYVLSQMKTFFDRD